MPKEIKNVNVGDIVYMHSNLGPELKAMPRPRLGTVRWVNGFYIGVQPNAKEWTQEFYRNEITHYIKRKQFMKNTTKILLLAALFLTACSKEQLPAPKKLTVLSFAKDTVKTTRPTIGNEPCGRCQPVD